MYQRRKRQENTMLLLLDLLCLLVSAAAAFGLRFGLFFGRSETGDQVWHVIFMGLLFITVNVFVRFNEFFFRRSPLEEAREVIRMEAIFAVSWVALLYLMHRTNELSRTVFGLFLLINIPLTCAARLLFKRYMITIFKKGRYSSRMLLLTTSDRVEAVVENLIAYDDWNRILKGIVLLDKKGTGGAVCGFPVVADREGFLDYLVHNDIDEVFIVSPDIRHEKLLQHWMAEMELMGIIVDVDIDLFDIKTCGKRTVNQVGKYAVVTFARNIFTPGQMAAKRLLDILGSLVGLMILGIAFIFVAPAIKLDSPGPVFFGQTRIGKNGRRFTFYKFRSMYQDAEQRKNELMNENQVKGLMFKMENDPRITRVGRFLRRTSIDELPQFWNVLRGDMSLVGTRPPTVDEFERYEAKHKCRLSMIPGLTGLWQISGRSRVKDFDQVVKLDMQYIDNWSILLDIKIILLTVGVVIKGKGSQ